MKFIVQSCQLTDLTQSIAQTIIDLVIGAHHQQYADLMLVMCGSAHTLSVFLSLGQASTTQTMLSGFFPGIVLEPISALELARLLDPHLRVWGVITGVPGWQPSLPNLREKKREERGHSQSVQLERVVRGMYGASWIYLVQAHPRPRHKMVEQRMKVIDLLSEVTSRMNMQWTSTKQESLQVTSVSSGSETRTEKFANGKKKATWELIKEGKPNHEWDKASMLMIFMAILGIIGQAESGSAPNEPGQ